MKGANGPLSIHIVGGPASVTPGHVAVLRAYGTIDRIGGADRYAVAAGVAARMRSVLRGAYPRTALVANGNMAAYFFNALAASPVAAKGHFPILLVKNGSVPPATASALGSYATRYVIGDSSAVNATAYAQAGGTSRLGGADRFAVAVSVAEHFTAGGPLTWNHVGVAARLPDALTGGASLGLLGGPILFIDPSSLPVATGDTLAAHKGAIQTLYLLGGTSSITPAAEAQIRARLGL
jgi:putative cell wall-binding protein